MPSHNGLDDILSQNICSKHFYSRDIRRILNYKKIITFFDSTHNMSMGDIVAIGAKTPNIDSMCFLEKFFY